VTVDSLQVNQGRVDVGVALGISAEDAAVTTTLGGELVSTQSPPAEGNMRRNDGCWPPLRWPALIGAGWSNEPAENGNAGNTNATNRGKAVKFAECMRDNGVSEFPDADASGG
jgi:hypothetical protein